MADKIPIRGAYNASSALTGLAEYATSETVGISFGGTGLATVGSNQLLTGNGTSALTSESSLTYDGTTLATTAFTATGNVSLDGGTFVFNESGADKDFRVEGDSEANLLMIDASTDRIGIGTATPSHLVDIEGVGHAATCFVSADLCATTKVVSPALCIGSQYALPAADGSAGQIMCTDGSGAIVFATASAGVTLAGSTNNTIATVTGANALAGEANLTFDGSTLTVAGALSATGNISFDGGSFVFNESGADKDFRIEGDTDANLFVADASTDRIGIGTATPGAKLQIVQANNDYVTRVTSATDGDYKAQLSIEGEVGIFKLWADGSASGDDPTIILHGSTGIAIGTASPNYPLDVRSAAVTESGFAGTIKSLDSTALAADTGAGFLLGGVYQSGGGQTSFAGIKAYKVNSTNGDYGGGLKLYTRANGSNQAERVRVAPDGEFKIISNKSDGGAVDIVNSASSTPRGMSIKMTGGVTGTTSEYFLYLHDNAGERAVVLTNGNIINANNSYGAISDIKIKQDITDARDYWDDFKAVRFRKFRRKEDVLADADAPAQFGVVAQELEAVFPGLISESNDIEERQVPVLDEDGNPTYTTDLDGNEVEVTEKELIDLGTTTKSAKYSVLSQIGLKVVQELQARLEAAEAKIAALESA